MDFSNLLYPTILYREKNPTQTTQHPPVPKQIKARTQKNRRNLKTGEHIGILTRVENPNTHFPPRRPLGRKAVITTLVTTFRNIKRTVTAAPSHILSMTVFPLPYHLNIQEYYKLIMGQIAKVRSGIPGLDELVGGGFPQGRSILVYGGPGSGKTTFCIQYLYNGAVDFGETGVLITLNETPSEIRANMSNFGWDLEALEKKGLLLLLDFRAIQVSSSGYISLSQEMFRGDTIPFSQLAKRITDKVRALKAKRLAVDSLTALTFQSNQPEVITRYGILGLFQVLNQLGCTSLMVAETRFNQKLQDQVVAPLELFLASGVINLYCDIELEGVRAIQVQKMRGVKHDSGIHPFRIDKDGIKVDYTGKVRFLR